MATTFAQTDFKVGMTFTYKGKSYVVKYVGLFYDRQSFNPFGGEYGIRTMRKHDFKCDVFIISDFANEQIDICK